MAARDITIVIIDDDIRFGEDLAYRLSRISRSRPLKLSPHAYHSVDLFLSDLRKGRFSRIDLVLIDEDARDFLKKGSEKSRANEGSQVILPQLYALMKSGSEPALADTVFALISGKLDNSEMEEVNVRIRQMRAIGIWPKERNPEVDFYSRIQDLFSESA